VVDSPIDKPVVSIPATPPTEFDRFLRPTPVEDTTSFKIDPESIHLTGHSMGGCGVWELVMARPSLFTTISPVCGHFDWEMDRLLNPTNYTPPTLIHGGGPTVCSSTTQGSTDRPLNATIENYFPSVWIWHGWKDECCAAAEALAMAEMLRDRYGTEKVQHVGWGEDHWAVVEAYEKSSDLFEWMVTQTHPCR